MNIRRIYVEKKVQYDVDKKKLLENIKRDLHIEALEDIQIIHRYDVDGVDDSKFEEICHHILAELPVDKIVEEDLTLGENTHVFATEYLPGQYDQRADSAVQCIQLLQPDTKAMVQYAKLFVLHGRIGERHINDIKKYVINPVDSREANLEKKKTLVQEQPVPDAIESIEGFLTKDAKAMADLKADLGLAMTVEDLLHTKEYFVKEDRTPTMTEIRVLDTYWSDHCRHTTFLTSLEKVDFEDHPMNADVKKAYQCYLQGKANVQGDKPKDQNLMDIALMAMKELRKEGKLEDLEVSDEINACSIKVKAMVNGQEEDWLVMFKNETHNHPTEIEPFGGAATCLGGAIRDPLSGRSYVYQGMRITGSGDPRASIEDTLSGKLPQKKIGRESAHGFSSYGNQIGLATGQVVEIYHEGYKAKHMELGAVVGATPAKHVIREQADPENIILLLGGKTGRDGCGGATGSSKAHTTQSIEECGAEVQKGNPPVERKIQRLFKREEVTTLIKKCNDFGAGGVCVAVGELADGLIIDLDAVPKKYEGLNGTEIAISESQERMAVVVEKKDVEQFTAYAHEENLEISQVAIVTEEKRLVMKWRGEVIVDISRAFLDTNGATQKAEVFVEAPNMELTVEKASKENWLAMLSDINVCSQKGLGEMFDSSIGASTVLSPYGGQTQFTPEQVMAAKLPVEHGDTETASIMSYCYDPNLTSMSPFHGAYYAVVGSIAKIIAAGGKWQDVRLTLQEFFERLEKQPSRWGKPFSALLGAYYAQRVLDIPAIGGKDSMSGSFHDLDVPPTLVSFAVNVTDAKNILSSDLKGANHVIMYAPLKKTAILPDNDTLRNHFDQVNVLVGLEGVCATRSITAKGVLEALSKMSFGNKVGFKLNDQMSDELLLGCGYGDFVFEIEKDSKAYAYAVEQGYTVLGETTETSDLVVGDMTLTMEEALQAFLSPLDEVYPMLAKEEAKVLPEKLFKSVAPYVAKSKIAKPQVIIPVFPGTNCEFDTAKAFENAGASVKTLVFKNNSAKDIKESIMALKDSINEANIIALAGGFSAGDEPDGSGKFITSVFRNPYITEATHELLKNRDGLMMGICNGFQALVKLGLVPYGEIVESSANAPTLTYNTIGRHISTYVQTKIVSNQSPWLQQVNVGDVHQIAVSHGEGRFIGDEKMIQELIAKGQVATQYVNASGQPTMDPRFNVNGSHYAVEGLLSPDGRIIGKMGHSERVGTEVAKNIYGNKDQQLFKSGVAYYR